MTETKKKNHREREKPDSDYNVQITDDSEFETHPPCQEMDLDCDWLVFIDEKKELKEPCDTKPLKPNVGCMPVIEKLTRLL